jgi:lipid-A-disaccharide synthase
MKALIVAGEASADIYGGELATHLQARIPDLEISGMGGDRMRQAGVRLLYDCGAVAVVGVFEVFSKLQKLQEAYRTLTKWIERNSPEFVILIDFPDFNFRLAKFLKKRRSKVIYFISPQIWAWRKGRIHFLKRHIDMMISILPFEPSLYDAHGIRNVYVGHPLVEIVQREIRLQSPFPRSEKPLLGLMPGSRDVEIRRHLPILLDTVELLRKELDLEVFLMRAPSLHSDLYDVPAYVQVVNDDRYSAMQACDFMLVASGTSTLEAAILRTPFLIVYRVGAFSWRLGKLLVRVPYYGLVNWIAQKKIVPEFIQNRMKPELLAREAMVYLQDKSAREKMKSELDAAVLKLGSSGAMERAADAILSLL